jgi:hypothetical protein
VTALKSDSQRVSATGERIGDDARQTTNLSLVVHDLKLNVESEQLVAAQKLAADCLARFKLT